jgi:hypothetical protein
MPAESLEVHRGEHQVPLTRADRETVQVDQHKDLAVPHERENAVDTRAAVYRAAGENEVQAGVAVAQIVKSAEQELTVILGKLSSADTGPSTFEWPKFWQNQRRGRVKVVQSPEQSGQLSDCPVALVLRDLRPEGQGLAVALPGECCHCW